MERAPTLGLITGLSMETGSIIKCMAEEFLPGPMEEHTKENTMTIRSKDMVFSPGLTVEDMRANGTMESNMVKVCILQVKMKPRMENGKKEKELNRQIM
jgi:hypothetical protein